MAVVYENNTGGFLHLAISDSDTVLTLLGTGDNWPIITGGDHAWVTLANAALIEVVRVTERNGNQLTVERGMDNTSARAWAASSTVVEMRVNMGLLEDIAASGGSGSGGHLLWHGGLNRDLADFTSADLTSLTHESAPGHHSFTIDGSGLNAGWTGYIVTQAPDTIENVTEGGLPSATYTDPMNTRQISDALGNDYNVYSSGAGLIAGISLRVTLDIV